MKVSHRREVEGASSVRQKGHRREAKGANGVRQRGKWCDCEAKMV